jgi:hypothetical protein
MIREGYKESSRQFDAAITVDGRQLNGCGRLLTACSRHPMIAAAIATAPAAVAAAAAAAAANFPMQSPQPLPRAGASGEPEARYRGGGSGGGGVCNRRCDSLVASAARAGGLAALPQQRLGCLLGSAGWGFVNSHALAV